MADLARSMLSTRHPSHWHIRGTALLQARPPQGPLAQPMPHVARAGPHLLDPEEPLSLPLLLELLPEPELDELPLLLLLPLPEDPVVEVSLSLPLLLELPLEPLLLLLLPLDEEARRLRLRFAAPSASPPGFPACSPLPRRSAGTSEASMNFVRACREIWEDVWGQTAQTARTPGAASQWREHNWYEQKLAAAP